MCSDDGTLTEDCALKQWSDLLNEAFRGNGRPMDTALDYERQLAEAGFVDVSIVKEKWPTNRWPKDQKYKQIGESTPPPPCCTVLGNPRVRVPSLVSRLTAG